MTHTPEKPDFEPDDDGLSTDGPDGLFPAALDDVRLTQAQLGDLLGVSRQAVGKQVKRGALRVDGDGLMPARRALADWRRNVDPSRTRARFNPRRTGAADPALLQRLEAIERRLAEDLGELPGDDGAVPGGLAAVRADLLRVQLERARFLAERERREWIRVAEVDEALTHFAAIMRGALMDLPARIGFALSLEGDAAQLAHNLVSETTHAWQWELARALARLNPNGEPIPGDPLHAAPPNGGGEGEAG